MLRRLHDHFVRADAVHLVEQAFALAIQFAFDSQRRKPVRHHANAPTRRVRPAAIAPIHQNFRRRLDLRARDKMGQSLGP